LSNSGDQHWRIQSGRNIPDRTFNINSKFNRRSRLDAMWDDTIEQVELRDKNLWLWGQERRGKSTIATMKAAASKFGRGQEKWWDGWSQELSGMNYPKGRTLTGPGLSNRLADFHSGPKPRVVLARSILVTNRLL